MKTLDCAKEMLLMVDDLHRDLSKVIVGNKRAAQRVRVKSIAFAKVAREFRKHSVSELAVNKPSGGKHE